MSSEKAEYIDTLNHPHQHLDKYKIDKFYKFITGLVLSSIVLILILILVRLQLSLAMQQAIVGILGVVLLAALDALRRSTADDPIPPAFPLTVYDNRVISSNAVYNTSYAPDGQQNEQQNIAEVAKEIQLILEKLSQDKSVETQSEKIAVTASLVEELNQDLTLQKRILQALQAGGAEAMKQAIHNSLAGVAVSAIIASAISGWKSDGHKS